MSVREISNGPYRIRPDQIASGDFSGLGLSEHDLSRLKKLFRSRKNAHAQGQDVFVRRLDKGDTLSGIAQADGLKGYGPLWRLNPHIPNPHWIREGDFIFTVSSLDPAPLIPAQPIGEQARVDQPPVFEGHFPVQAIPQAGIPPFLKKTAFASGIPENEPLPAGGIASKPTEKGFFSDYLDEYAHTLALVGQNHSIQTKQTILPNGTMAETTKTRFGLGLASVAYEKGKADLRVGSNRAAVGIENGKGGYWRFRFGNVAVIGAFFKDFVTLKWYDTSSVVNNFGKGTEWLVSKSDFKALLKMSTEEAIELLGSKYQVGREYAEKVMGSLHAMGGRSLKGVAVKSVGDLVAVLGLGVALEKALPDDILARNLALAVAPSAFWESVKFVKNMIAQKMPADLGAQAGKVARGFGVSMGASLAIGKGIEGIEEISGMDIPTPIALGAQIFGGHYVSKAIMARVAQVGIAKTAAGAVANPVVGAVAVGIGLGFLINWGLEKVGFDNNRLVADSLMDRYFAWKQERLDEKEEQRSRIMYSETVERKNQPKQEAA